MGFLLAGDVEEEGTRPHPRPLPIFSERKWRGECDPTPSRLQGGGSLSLTPIPSPEGRGGLAVGTHEEAMSGGEHAGAGFDVLAEVLSTDEGMVATQFANFVLKMSAIKRIMAGDLFSINDEDALQAVLVFEFEGETFFAFEEGIDCPGCAGENAGGVAGGSHGREALVVNGLIDVLGFVDDEQAVGSWADDTGGGIGGEVGSAGGHETIDVAIAFAKATQGKERTLMGTGSQTFHGVDSLRAKGGLDADDRGADGGEAAEEVEDEVREEFVLAGLAGEDDDEGVAIAGKDGFKNSVSGLELIRPELDGKEASRKAVEIVQLALEFLALRAGEVSDKFAAFGGGEFREHGFLPWSGREDPAYTRAKGGKYIGREDLASTA